MVITVLFIFQNEKVFGKRQTFIDFIWNEFRFFSVLYKVFFSRLCLLEVGTHADIPDGKAYVDHISVSSKFRGKGVGKILLDTADADAKKRGCKASINGFFNFTFISSRWKPGALFIAVWNCSYLIYIPYDYSLSLSLSLSQ